ncbi:hypothetical protein J1N35_016609 [Gossypium stocksii]|uniref:Uncharacterized protein n=1 Tax=Gossypium stocksii TaxID=47602 RepID=A0A9D3VLI3_9ROSI|nr:hypothetical protein J1N35_016609 [Gossypium stocksii]
MTRRLKNRERQRKIVARKRLEADMQKSHVLNRPTIPNAELQLNGILNNVMKRVHCKRTGKKMLGGLIYTRLKKNYETRKPKLGREIGKQMQERRTVELVAPSWFRCIA